MELLAIVREVPGEVAVDALALAGRAPPGDDDRPRVGRATRDAVAGPHEIARARAGRGRPAPVLPGDLRHRAGRVAAVEDASRVRVSIALLVGTPGPAEHDRLPVRGCSRAGGEPAGQGHDAHADSSPQLQRLSHLPSLAQPK